MCARACVCSLSHTGFYTGLLGQLWVVPYFCSYHLVMRGVYSLLDRLRDHELDSLPEQQHHQ
jgi:hypothetical protein